MIADEDEDTHPTIEEAGDFLREVADRVGIAPEAAAMAFEDPWHFMAKERKLPDNVDPSDSKLEDPQERARMARTFERGLDKPTG